MSYVIIDRQKPFDNLLKIMLLQERFNIFLKKLYISKTEKITLILL